MYRPPPLNDEIPANRVNWPPNCSARKFKYKCSSELSHVMCTHKNTLLEPINNFIDYIREGSLIFFREIIKELVLKV